MLSATLEKMDIAHSWSTHLVLTGHVGNFSLRFTKDLRQGSVREQDVESSLEFRRRRPTSSRVAFFDLTPFLPRTGILSSL